MPVDQSAATPLRRAFCASVMGLSIGELQMYWQRRVAADRVFPPPTKASDQEVLEYVAAHAGAIGYVGSGVEIPDGVKVIVLHD
jgi:hypothetical protein